MLQRVKQFFSAIQAKMTNEDLVFLELYLTEQEKTLFLKMDIPTQKHAIKVAKTSLSIANEVTKSSNQRSKINISLLVKAALLHDIGKPAGGLKTWHRVIIVLLEKLLAKDSFEKLCQGTSAVNNKTTGLRFALYLQKNHPKLGGSLARQYKLDSKVINLIETHHDVINEFSSSELCLLQKADELN